MSNSRAAYMREYRKRRKVQSGVPLINRSLIVGTGNSRAAYMREYRKRRKAEQQNRETSTKGVLTSTNERVRKSASVRNKEYRQRKKQRELLQKLYYSNCISAAVYQAVIRSDGNSLESDTQFCDVKQEPFTSNDPLADADCKEHHNTDPLFVKCEPTSIETESSSKCDLIDKKNEAPTTFDSVENGMEQSTGALFVKCEPSIEAESSNECDLLHVKKEVPTFDSLENGIKHELDPLAIKCEPCSETSSDDKNET